MKRDEFHVAGQAGGGRSTVVRSLAIQGELGSNSHVAVLALFAHLQETPAIVACTTSPQVVEMLVSNQVDAAVLPIENSLHGSVAEHYDLLLHHPVRMARESLLHVRHNVIVQPGTTLRQLKRILSHPVALSQCRIWLSAHPELEVVSFYDTAGSVKHLMDHGLPDVAGIGPELAALQYGGEVLQHGIEDHAENFTRFHLIVREDGWRPAPDANKSSVAFTLHHRPGTLVRALQEFASSGINLTKIESRPVPGRPWEYVFFADLRFTGAGQIDSALQALRVHCEMVRELGRYVAAEIPESSSRLR